MKPHSSDHITITPQLARQRKIKREANARLRQRERDAKRNCGDQVRFSQVPLLQSEIDELMHEVKIGKSDNIIISDRKWDELVGRTIAAAVRWAIKEKRSRK